MMLFLVGDSYTDGTPGENRFKGLCRGMVNQGVSVCRVFLRPDHNRLMAHPDSDGVVYKYLWKGKTLSSGKYRHIQQIFWLISFLKTLNNGAHVIVTNSDYLYVYLLFPKLHIYHEKSEYPELNLNGQNLFSRLILHFYLKTCRTIDGVFPISAALRDYFVSRGVRPDRLCVINMTVDPERFINLGKQNCADRYFAYCGAVSKYKDGVDLMIKSFAIVAQKCDWIKLYIIGNFVFHKDEDDIRGLIAGLCLKERVIFTGSVSRDAMPQILKDAEALLLERPDNVQAKYGFPTKLGEYLLTGNPVIVTAVGDIPLFLKDGVSAYIAPAGDVEAFADRMMLAINSPSAREIGKRGCEVAMQKFNSMIESKKIVDFIYGEK